LIKGDNTTDEDDAFAFIYDVIDGVNVFGYNNQTFFNRYSGYKEPQ